MANETVTKSTRFYCVSLVPDICKTPIGPSNPPVPYTVIGEFSQADKVSPNVKAHSEPVILHNRSFIPTVKGDEPGKAGGIKSGTCGKKVETRTASKTYFANGTATVQEGCEVWMNDRNTVGKIYERGGAAPRTRLEQIAAMAEEKLKEVADEARSALRPLAQQYKDNMSAALHEAAADAMDKGGKVAMGGMAMTGAGVVAGATLIAAPVGVPLTAAGAVGTAAGTAVTGIGAMAESGATLLDYAADYILTNKTPNFPEIALNAGRTALSATVGNKVPGLGAVLKKSIPGQKPARPPSPPPRPPDSPKGGKTRKKKGEKSDKPSECCPKNQAPGGKPVSSRHPVHLGTGEEVLYQTDFVIEGVTPLEWTRCYRSGSELEDWGLCGARWATPFTASLAVTGKGIVYIDDSGRPMLLPRLEVGASLDNRKEGFTLTRPSASEFVLTWRDGSSDTFIRAASSDSWLPHGYDGVNAMRPPWEPVLAERYVLRRSAGRDGRGISIERFADAWPGGVLLRVRSDEGTVIEAMRDEQKHRQAPGATDGAAEPPRIGRVEEVRADGSRICHVRYQYEVEPEQVRATADPFSSLPVRYNLVRQTNLAGDARTYSYRHHLLIAYTTYTGFSHSLDWISLAALRERWGGNTLAYEELRERFPVTLANSYQARAIATATADGRDSVRIAYLDEDTTRVTDANGGVLDYTFDANWLAVDVRRVNENGTASSLGQRVWDGDGMLLAEVDAADRATRYTYDAAGNLTSTTDALGNTSRIEYDAHNQPVAVTDPLGNVTRLEYDNNGNLTAQTDALGHVTRYRYDGQGRLVGLQDAKGGNKEIRYDRAGRLASYTDCSGYRTLYEYDASGRLSAVIDALEQVARYEYDALGSMTSVTQADGAKELFAYDAEGRLTIHTDAAGYKTAYRYNGHGLPVERIDALGFSVKYRYDALLQLVELINQNGESYFFTYDAEGSLTSETGFDGKVTRYSYDATGQLIASECAGKRIDLLRDVLGQLLAKQTADGVYRYQYDGLGRLTAVSAPHAHNSFEYDALGQLIEERSAYFISKPQQDLVGPRSPDAAFVMTHAYDELGNRIQTVLPNGRRIDILRYGSGHWHGVLWDGETIVDIERDRLHREKLRRYRSKGAISAVREYDAQSRITRMTLRRATDEPDHPLRDRKFKYDVTGNLLEIEHGWHTRNDTLGTFSYRYDPLGQLLSAIQPGLTENFAFDPVGNLISPAAPAATSISKSSADSCVQQPIQNNLFKTYLGHRYTYDEHGNVVNKRLEQEDSTYPMAELCLTYDAENRVILAVRTQHNATITARYFYDSYSRRIAKHIETEPICENTIGRDSCQLRRHHRLFSVWDGELLVQELKHEKTVSYVYEPDSFIPLARNEASSAPLRANSLLYQYFERHNPDLSEYTQYFNCDHLGTPRELVDISGFLFWHSEGGAWGRDIHTRCSSNQISDKIGCMDQPLRFQGQHKDDETGLHYNRYRYYDPEASRFITQDPIGLIAGLNSYAFVPNPTGWVDPLGLSRIRGGCDPCCGQDPSAEARATQGKGDYKGVDTYTNVVLRKGTILYSLYPGSTPGFAVTNHTLRKAQGAPLKYAQLTQVVPGVDSKTGRPRSMRTMVKVYRVSEDICVAKGIARAQNPLTHGPGGATQYYISTTDQHKLTTKETLRQI